MCVFYEWRADVYMQICVCVCSLLYIHRDTVQVLFCILLDL